MDQNTRTEARRQPESTLIRPKTDLDHIGGAVAVVFAELVVRHLLAGKEVPL